MHVTFPPDAPPADTVAFDDFLRLDIRLGTVVEARAFPEARKPALILQIDFGPGVGIRKSSAQIATHYAPEGLVGRRVMGVVNFAPRQIGPIRSEVLVLGFADADGEILLASAPESVPDGARLA